MKNLLVALLLFVFSLQGLAVAAGCMIADTSADTSADASTALILPERTDASKTGAIIAVVEDAGDAGDADTTDVVPSIEEMSDYVALDLAVHDIRCCPTAMNTLPPRFDSIHLPTPIPPPRA